MGRGCIVKRATKAAIIGALLPVAIFSACAFAISMGVDSDTIKKVLFSIMAIVIGGIVGAIVGGEE